VSSLFRALLLVTLVLAAGQIDARAAGRARPIEIQVDAS